MMLQNNLVGITKTAALATLVVLLAMSVLAAVYPAMAAVVCPGCLGFERAEGQVYVEAGMSSAERAAVLDTVGAARRRLQQFYGTVESAPKIFICGDDACYRQAGGGGSRGMALLDFALFLSPRGTTVTIASHEMSHIELHTRIGLVRTSRRDVPQWFDEGVAVFVSDDQRYLKSASVADRCLEAPDGALPTTRSAWMRAPRP